MRRVSSAFMPATGSSSSSSSRLGAQRPGDLDPLLVAVGQDADRACRSLSPSSRNSAISRDPLAVQPALAGGPRQPQPGGEEPGLGEVVAAEHEVLGDASACPTARCSGTRGPPRCRRSGSGRIWSSRCVAEADLALGRLVDAGQDVEHRRLAGAVRPDDRVDRAGLDGERHLGQRLDRPEPHGDVLDLDRRDVRLGPSAAASGVRAVTPSTARASCPSRRRRRCARRRLVAVVAEVEALHLVGLRRAPARRPDSDTSPTSST